MAAFANFINEEKLNAQLDVQIEAERVETDVDWSREEVVAAGYEPCGRCKP